MLWAVQVHMRYSLSLTAYALQFSCSVFLCVVQLYLGDLGANEVLVNSSENMLCTLYTALGSRFVGEVILPFCCFTSTRHVCERSVHHSELNWERLLHFNWIPQFEMIFKGVCKQVQNCKNCSRCDMYVYICIYIYIYIYIYVCVCVCVICIYEFHNICYHYIFVCNATL